MQKSENPEAFPTKKQLVDAGRMDLVEGIVKQGGWLSLGWDFDDGEEGSVQDCDGFTGWVSIMGPECDDGCFRRKGGSGEERSGLEGDEVRGFGVDSYGNNSPQSASSSGRSLELEAEDETGIEGILSRLEKQRNMTFGIGLRENRDSTGLSGNADVADWRLGSSTDMTVGGHEISGRSASLNLNKGITNDSGSKLSQDRYSSNFYGSRNLLKPEMWRNWSNQRAGFSNTEFEAAEISFNESRKGEATDTSKDEILLIREGAVVHSDGTKELNSSSKEIDHTHIKTRLQHLELELTSALCLLKSNADEFIAQKLSDAWEFQENEIMSAQDKLRSIRAKLAVLEGKMALTIIDAQKIVEEKQKRIDDTRRALRLLRTACIVWPNAASEVLLSGSFDGWATQRKMERSSTGIFSLCLKLYPGRYEIKFIVDGIWRIDPLRPIVHSSGYENNLLIIT
ncbi:hypothetical protein L1049_007187 [Liquidambar formosana]|uniref:AMP-activated protein kinase glycogen-binding domain-containing protein n=1 Tax=Liquidambar formosana TaxID=63359 RepID=A0AAP0RGT2_LIQFO